MVVLSPKYGRQKWNEQVNAKVAKGQVEMSVVIQDSDFGFVVSVLVEGENFLTTVKRLEFSALKFAQEQAEEWAYVYGLEYALI